MTKGLLRKAQENLGPAYLPIYDIYQASFCEYKGSPPLLTKQGSRVVFEFRATPETYELLREYQGNPLIPLLDFVAVLRRLRGRMLDARDGNDRRETKNGQTF
jgi:hypothetical protein